MARRWRAYYADGSTYSHRDGPPESAPGFGLVAIAQDGDPRDPHAPAREIQHRWDWYFWEPERGEWWGADLHGLLDRLCHRLPTSAVCAGRSVDTPTYRLLMKRAEVEEL